MITNKWISVTKISKPVVSKETFSEALKGCTCIARY